MRVLFRDWGLGIGDWAQSPIPKMLINILSIYSYKIYLSLSIYLYLFTIIVV